MYSHEIEQLLKLRNYIISSSEYFEILSTSPQINNVKYNTSNGSTEIKTDDRYAFKVRIYKKGNN